MHSKQHSLPYLRSTGVAEYTFLELFGADLGALLDFIWYQQRPQQNHALNWKPTENQLHVYLLSWLGGFGSIDCGLEISIHNSFRGGTRSHSQGWGRYLNRHLFSCRCTAYIKWVLLFDV